MKAQLAFLGVAAAISCCLASGDLVCPEQFDPMNPTFFPHPDCTKYYVCNWHDLLERSCPNGLHWNQQMSYCDYPSQAGCVSGTTTTASPATTTTTAPVTTTTPAPAPSGDCPEVYDPSHQVYFPHVDCSKYYICTYEGNKLEQNCPAGLHWSQASSYCDWPELAQCEKSSDEAAPVELECPEGYDPEHPVFFPHEQCEFFYVCVNGEAVEQVCPGDLHWNQDKGHCDFQDQVGCVAVTEPGTTEVTEEPTEEPSTEVPSTQEPSTEVPTTQEPSTEAPTTQAPTTEAPTTTQKPSTEAPAAECPLEEGDAPVFLPHADCSKYYMCEHGRPIELNCPPGTFWNATENVCDNPASSGCQQQ